MKNKFLIYWLNRLSLLVCLIMLMGCGSIKESAKYIIGFSTKALEQARENAIAESFYCDIDECYDVVLGMDRKINERENKLLKMAKESDEVVTKHSDDENGNIEFDDEIEYGIFDIFMQSRVKNYIVVMGIKGNVDTTEVGIFFSRPQRDEILVEISSLSTIAKEKVAIAVFDELGQNFERVQTN